MLYRFITSSLNIRRKTLYVFCLLLFAEVLEARLHIESIRIEELPKGLGFYDIIEAPNGSLYGAINGLWHNTGSGWSKFKADSDKVLYDLEFDSKGRLWVGGQDTLGYYNVTSSGKVVFESLLESLKSTDTHDSEFMKVVSLGENSIFAVSRNTIYQIVGDNTRNWKFEGQKRVLVSEVNDRLFAYQRGIGLFEYLDSDFRLVFPETESTSGGVIAIFEEDEEFVMFTVDGKVLRWSKNDGIVLEEPLEIEGKRALILNCERLDHRFYILSTMNCGLILLDNSLSVVSYLNSDSGLISDLVHTTHTDIQGRTWIGLSTGLQRIDAIGYHQIYGREENLSGSVYRIGKFNNDYYVTTSDGLKKTNVGETMLYFQGLDRLGKLVFSMASDDSGLFIGGFDGIYRMDTIGEVEKIYNTSNAVSSLALDYRDGKRLYCGSDSNFGALEYRGDSSEDVSEIKTDDWVSKLFVSNGKVLANINYKQSEKYTYKSGSLEHSGSHQTASQGDYIYFSSLGDSVAVHGKGVFDIYLPDAQSEKLSKFIEGNIDVNNYIIRSILKTESGKYLILFGRRPEEAGFFFETVLTRYDPVTEQHVYYAIPQSAIEEIGPIECSVIMESQFLVGGTNGLISLDYENLQRLKYPDKPAVFSADKAFVRDSEEWLINYDSSRLLEFNFREGRKPPYDLKTEYSYRLSEADEDWSEWSEETRAEYLNLSEGSYRLEVRARDLAGRISEASVLSFYIQPPWYRTPYAYVSYILLFGLMLWLYSAIQNYSLRRANRRLEESVQLRTKQLVSANDALKKANEAKTEFLSNMSHELRSPLNTISLLSDVLVRGREKSGDQKYLRHLKSSTKLLSSMVDDILDVEKIENGKLSMNKEEFELDEVLQHLVQMYEAQAQKKGLNFDARILLQSGSSVGDPISLQKILGNLLGNAIKFTEAGSVGFEVREVGGDSKTVNYKATVADTGRGISKEDQKHIFERFYRAETHKYSIQGTGLGLTIAKAYADLIGGRLEFESEPRKGTRFELEFCLEKAGQCERAEAPPFTLNHKSVLLVEDDDEQRELTSQILSSMGVTVDAVCDRTVASDRLKNGSYDHLLVDLNTPGKEIEDFIHALNGSHNNQYRITVISANATPEAQRKAFNLGITGFICKPLTVEKLYNELTGSS